MRHAGKPYESDASEHIGLVRMCAARFYGRGIPYDDLFQQGCVGLMNAVKRFDPARGVRFSTYAVPVILFEIRRFTDTYKPMHVPRTDREAFKRARAARGKLLCELGREPTFQELARETGISPEELAGLISCQNRMDAITVIEAACECPAAEPAGFEDGVLLWDAIERLPKPLPRLITLRFVERMTQKRTGEIMNMSQAQVSRLEARARKLLEGLLAG